jgi:hypothetical protein
MPWERYLWLRAQRGRLGVGWRELTLNIVAIAGTPEIDIAQSPECAIIC